MFLLSIIIMAAGFIGVLVAAKLRQQPIAVVCALVMLAGLGMYGWYTFNPPPNTDYKVYDKAVNAEMAANLSGFSKIYWMTNEASGEYFEERLADFKERVGKEVEILAPEASSDGMVSEMNSKKVQELMKDVPADAVVVIDMSLFDGAKLEFLKSSYKGPKVFLSPNTSIMGVKKNAVKTAFTKGNIVGMIIYKSSNDEEFEPSDSDLKEAFNYRYTLIDKNNIDSNMNNLPF